MARTNLTENDEGKKVVNAEGEEIGIVSGFRGGQAFVDPDPSITDKIMSKLGWQDADADDYALDEDHVEQITDDEIHLSGGL